MFLFRYDAVRNAPRQFLWMSAGGFAASGAMVALLLALVPLDTLAGRMAMALTAAGVLATAMLEIPVFVRVARGAPIPRGAAYVGEHEAG